MRNNCTPRIKRTILALGAAGVTKVVVVTGYQAEAVRDSLRDPAYAAAGIEVVPIHNSEFEKANGISVLVGGAALVGPFVLSTDDLMLTPAVARVMASQDVTAADLILATDARIQDIPNIDDAIKVRSDAGRIVAIGRQLTAFDRIACGVFAVTPRLLEELAAVRAENGDCSLTDGVRRLAEVGRARTADVRAELWQEVNPAAAGAHAEAVDTGHAPRTDVELVRGTDRSVTQAFWENRALNATDPRSVTLSRQPAWATRLLLRLYQGWLMRRLPKARSRVTVDLACGNGDWTVKLASRADRIIAVDFSAGMVEACRAQLASAGLVDRASLLCGDVSEVEVPSCDLVVAGAVTKYLSDDRVDALLLHVHAALAEDGVFYLRTTVSRTGATQVKSDAGFQGIYRPKRWFDARLAAAGFEILETSTATEFVADEIARTVLGPLWPLLYSPIYGFRRVIRSRMRFDGAVYLARRRKTGA